MHEAQGGNVPNFAQISANYRGALQNDEKARGSMQREGNARNETINARMAMAKNALTNLSSDLGESLKPALLSTLETTLAITQGIRNWAKENPQLAAGIMTVVKGLAFSLTVIGGLMLVAAAVLGPIAMMKFGLTALGISGFSAAGLLGRGFSLIMGCIGAVGRILLMNPIGLAITGIATAAFLIYQYWEPIKTFFGGLWNQVKQAFNGGLLGILALIADWSPVGLFYQAMASVLSYFGIELPGKFSEFGANLMGGLVSGIRNGIQAAKEAIGAAGDAVVGFFKEKLGIHSPSRVFDDLGQFTMQGLEQGLAGGEKGPLNAVSKIIKKLTGIGAGLTLSSMALAQPPGLPVIPPEVQRVVAEPRQPLELRAPVEAFCTIIDQHQATDLPDPLAALRPVIDEHRPVELPAPMAAFRSILDKHQAADLPDPLAGLGAGLAIDERPARRVDRSESTAARQVGTVEPAPAPMQVTINIYGTPGQDPAAIRREVELALANAEARRAAQHRSRLRDQE